MEKEYKLGSIVVMKKQHPCGSHEWEILRIGADFRLKYDDILTKEEYIERLNNYRKHDTLGLSYQLNIIEKVNKLASKNKEELLNVLSQLIKENTISPIIRICK